MVWRRDYSLRGFFCQLNLSSLVDMRCLLMHAGFSSSENKGQLFTVGKQKTHPVSKKPCFFPPSSFHFPCLLIQGTTCAESSDWMWNEEMKCGSIKLLVL